LREWNIPGQFSVNCNPLIYSNLNTDGVVWLIAHLTIPRPSHQIPLIPSGLINPCKILTMPQTLNLHQINQPKVGMMRGCKIPCKTSLGKTWPHRAGYHAPTAATVIFRSTENFSILMSFTKPRRNKRIPNNEAIDISDVTTQLQPNRKHAKVEP